MLQRTLSPGSSRHAFPRKRRYRRVDRGRRSPYSASGASLAVAVGFCLVAFGFTGQDALEGSLSVSRRVGGARARPEVPHGKDWHLGGFPVDPPTASMGSSSEAAQLLQTMAAFGGGSGAAESLNAAPIGAAKSHKPLLTKPQQARERPENKHD